jgi:integrase
MANPAARVGKFISMLIQGGESLVYVKEQLGHHSIKITVDVYGHLIPGTNKAAVDRLDEATGRNPHATDLWSGLRVVQGGQ